MRETCSSTSTEGRSGEGSLTLIGFATASDGVVDGSWSGLRGGRGGGVWGRDSVAADADTGSKM